MRNGEIFSVTRLRHHNPQKQCGVHALFNHGKSFSVTRLRHDNPLKQGSELIFPKQLKGVNPWLVP
jgi:hypothetical protein